LTPQATRRRAKPPVFGAGRVLVGGKPVVKELGTKDWQKIAKFKLHNVAHLCAQQYEHTNILPAKAKILPACPA